MIIKNQLEYKTLANLVTVKTMPLKLNKFMKAFEDLAFLVHESSKDIDIFHLRFLVKLKRFNNRIPETFEGVYDIYDIYDDPKRYNNPIEEHDNINLELKYIIDALIYPNYKESSAFTSIFSFIYSLKNLPEIKYDLTIQNKIDKLVTKYKIGQPKKK